MPVFRNHQVAFIHIPKCGGTSVEVALGWAERYPAIGLEPTQTEPDYQHLFGGGLQHLTAKEVRLLYLGEAYDNYHRVATIRDPFDRILSHYLWKSHRFTAVNCNQDELAVKLDTFVDQVWKTFKSSDIFLRPRLGFVASGSGESEDFCANDIRRHLLPQCAYLYADGTLIVDQIYCLTRLPELVSSLHKRLGTSRPLEKRMAAHDAFDPMRLLSSESIEKLHELYRDDIDLHNRVLSSEGIWPGSPHESGSNLSEQP